MKTTILAVLALAGALSGCASEVTTFDAQGNLIGKCRATGGWIIGGGSSCSGLANGQSGGLAGAPGGQPQAPAAK